MRNKSKQINFRVSEKDYNKILKRAEKTNMNLTGYLLTLALEGEIIIVEGLPEMITELNKIGNNLNQLTRLCHQGIINAPDLAVLKESVMKIWQSLNSLTRRGA